MQSAGCRSPRARQREGRFHAFRATHLVRAGFGSRTDVQIVLDRINEVFDARAAGGRRLGFDHDGLEAERLALVEISEQGREINRRLGKGIGDNWPRRRRRRAQRSCCCSTPQRPARRQHGSDVRVGEAAAAVGRPAPGQEVRHLAAAGERETEQDIVGGASAIRPGGSKRAIGVSVSTFCSSSKSI